METEGTYIYYNDILKANCPFKAVLKTNECHGYEEIVGSTFIALLTLFKSNDDEVDALEDDKLIEYAILWLSYKLNQKQNIKFKNLKDFYDKYIKDNGNIYNNDITGVDAYNSYKDIINEKINMKTINIKEMSIFYDLLKLLCDIYTEFDSNNSDCTKCSQKANEFVENYKKLNGDSGIDKDSPYYQVLYILSNDYNNLKDKCSEFQSLPPIKIAHSSVKGHPDNSVHISEDTSSSSSIASTLIPILSIFSIPIFLGIAYKVIIKNSKITFIIPYM